MSNPRYPEEFKIQAVNQVTEKKLPVADVAARFGVSTYSFYAWVPNVINLYSIILQVYPVTLWFELQPYPEPCGLKISPRSVH